MNPTYQIENVGGPFLRTMPVPEDLAEPRPLPPTGLGQVFVDDSVTRCLT
mgnify:CR=1